MGSALGRIRSAVLWLVAGCALAGTIAVGFYEPGVLAEGVTGVMEGEPVTMGLAFQMAGLVALPLAMAAVTLFLPTRAGAITNLVVAVPLGAFGLVVAFMELAEGAWPAHVTLGAFAAAIAWLIVGLSIVELRRLARGGSASA